MKTICIGAGFTGLACGIKTGCTVYEQSDHAGGICTDYVKDGFRFSNGGPHWIFGKDKGLEYIKSLVEVKEYERKAGVYYNHTFPYPFQNITPEGWSMHAPKRTDNFKNWLMDSFGADQCGMFFYPFNEKYTAGLMDKIMPQDAYKSPSGRTNGWVSTFCDPVNGLSDLVEKMASKCDIKYNNRIIDIDSVHKEIRTSQEEIIKYDRIISTIPLSHICGLSGYYDFKAPYTSVLVLNIGAEVGACTPKEHWLYIPFCKSGFHRVAFYTNVDDSKGPKGTVGLSVEMAFYNRKPKTSEYAKIVRDVVQELQEWRWIDGSDPIIVSPNWVECAYTWQYNKEDVPNALAWLKERDIISTGRYGKWAFQGLTKSIEDGFNVEN